MVGDSTEIASAPQAAAPGKPASPRPQAMRKIRLSDKPIGAGNGGQETR